MKRFFTLIIIFFFASSILAQSITPNEGSIKQKRYLEKIPYQNKDGKLIVSVTINGKAYNFLFDTGATLSISDKLFKELNLDIITQKGVVDASGKREEMRVVLLPELHLQRITFINTQGIVNHEVSTDFVNLLDCFEIDGTIGSNMLRNSAVQIDEQSKQIIITNNVKKLSIKRTYYQNIELDNQSSPYIGIVLQKGEQKVFDRVLFDTGDAGGLYTMWAGFYNWLDSLGNFANKIAESEGSFKWSAHGIDERQKYLLLNISELNLNNTIFNDVVVTTTNGRSRVGSKLLQYGKVTLDYKNKRFYFKPFENINTNELSESPWAILPTWQNGKLVVGLIWDKALEHQINLGDEILSVNGIDVRLMDICEYFNSSANSFSNNTSSNNVLILELKDITTGEVKNVEIK